jgi:hypothetical protein
LADIHSQKYAIARSYMLRLKREDFADAHETAKLAATCGVSLETFTAEFAYLIDTEPPRLKMDPEKRGFVEDHAALDSSIFLD